MSRLHGDGGRVCLSVGARARTSPRPTLAAFSRLFPRTGSTPMVMVPRGRCWWWLTTMFQGHPPLPPLSPSRSSFGSLSQICTVKLLTLLPANLASPFFSPPSTLGLSPAPDRSSILSLATDSNDRPRYRALIARFFVVSTDAVERGNLAARKPREKCRGPRRRRLNAIFTAPR